MGTANFLLLGFLFAGFEAFNFTVIQNFNFKVLENRDDIFDFIRIVNAFREGFIDILVGQEALLFRESYENADAFVEFFLCFWREASFGRNAGDRFITDILRYLLNCFFLGGCFLFCGDFFGSLFSNSFFGSLFNRLFGGGYFFGNCFFSYLFGDRLFLGDCFWRSSWQAPFLWLSF